MPRLTICAAGSDSIRNATDKVGKIANPTSATGAFKICKSLICSSSIQKVYTTNTE